MHIVDPRPDYLLLRDLVARAGCTAKTVRRAVRLGELPRRYAVGKHGPQLVFMPAEVERWLKTSDAHPRRGRGFGRLQRTLNARQAGAVAGQLARLQAEHRTTVAAVSSMETAQAERDRALTAMSVALAALAERVCALERQRAGSKYP
jgi:hypothetical protein